MRCLNLLFFVSLLFLILLVPTIGMAEKGENENESKKEALSYWDELKNKYPEEEALNIFFSKYKYSEYGQFLPEVERLERLLINIEKQKFYPNRFRIKEIKVGGPYDSLTAITTTQLPSGILSSEGTIEKLLPGRQQNMLGHGAIHRFKGRVTITFENIFNGNDKYTFIGDENDPVTFGCVRDIGFVYLHGKGKVILPNGDEVDLGYVEKKKDTTPESKEQTETSGVYAKEEKATLVGKVEMKYVKPIKGIHYDVVGDESLIEVDEVLNPCITVTKATDKNGKVISEMKGKSIIVFGKKTSELEKFDGKEVQVEGIIKDNKAIDVTTVTEITKRVEHALTSVEQKNEQKTKQVEGTSTIPQDEKKKKLEDGNQLDTKNKQKNSPEATTFPFDFINILEEIYKKTVNVSGTFEFKKGMKLPESSRMARDSFEDFRKFFGDDFFDNKIMPSLPEDIKGKFCGTGFLIDSDGYILTGYRLIEGANSIIVTLWDNNSYKGKIVIFDKDADIALIKIYPESKSIPVAKLCYNEIKAGEHFLAVGKLSVDSCNFTFDSIKSIDEYIQIKDIILSKYLYGGPLFNIRGEIIGVITLPSIEGNKLREAKQQETVFVVPSSKINKLIQKMDYKKSNSKSLAGCKNYGMTVQNFTKELAKSFDIKEKNLDVKEWCGVIVTNVLSRSPAGISDIRKGDRIIEMNRKKINDTVGFEEALSEADEEKGILFLVKRGEFSLYIIIKSDRK